MVETIHETTQYKEGISLSFRLKYKRIWSEHLETIKPYVGYTTKRFRIDK